jgi:hypothetical protein
LGIFRRVGYVLVFTLKELIGDDALNKMKVREEGSIGSEVGFGSEYSGHNLNL